MRRCVGEAASLPGSADWVHDWQSFWVELWVSTPDATPAAIAVATVDLQYNTQYLAAQEIIYGPAFVRDWTGTIDGAHALVSKSNARQAPQRLGGDGRESLIDRRLSDALYLLDDPTTDRLLDGIPSVLYAPDASGPPKCN